MIPDFEDCYDLDRVIGLFEKEEILRQLPYNRRISWNDLFNLNINYRELLTVSENDWKERRYKSFRDLLDSFSRDGVNEKNNM